MFGSGVSREFLSTIFGDLHERKTRKLQNRCAEFRFHINFSSKMTKSNLKCGIFKIRVMIQIREKSESVMVDRQIIYFYCGGI